MVVVLVVTVLFILFLRTNPTGREFFDRARTLIAVNLLITSILCLENSSSDLPIRWLLNPSRDKKNPPIRMVCDSLHRTNTTTKMGYDLHPYLVRHVRIWSHLNKTSSGSFVNADKVFLEH